MSLSSIAVWFLSAALGYFVVLLVVGVRASKTGEENRPFSEIKFWLWCLLKNGYDGENVLFRDTPKSRFIRFEKYTDAGESPGIKLTFPEIGWGKEFLPKLRDYAEKKGLAFRASDKNEPAYAHIMFGDDIDEAFALCQMIWSKFFRFDEQTPYLRLTADLSTINELLDIGAQPSDAERKKRFLLYQNARLKYAGLTWLQAPSSQRVFVIGVLIAASAIAYFTALIGLPIATLLALGDPPDWQFEFGQISFQGSDTSLILFSVYLLSHAIMRRIGRVRLMIGPGETGRLERPLLAPRKTVFCGIPVAVLLVWLRM